MTKFQIIGIVSLCIILVSYFRKFRSAAIDKILFGLILASGIFFILYPEVTNQMAHFLGIGRGADLIFYMAILGFGYLALILYSKIRKLEDQLTAIIRHQSLESVQSLNKHE
jgi:hypothetical protein